MEPTDQSPSADWVTVCWGLDLDADAQTLYQEMATLISGLIDLPAARSSHFAEVMQYLGGWSGMVEKVAEDGQGGFVVTLSVIGLVAADQLYGEATSLFTRYGEIYHVDPARRVTFVGPSIPPGSEPPFFFMAVG